MTLQLVVLQRRPAGLWHMCKSGPLQAHQMALQTHTLARLGKEAGLPAGAEVQARAATVLAARTRTTWSTTSSIVAQHLGPTLTTCPPMTAGAPLLLHAPWAAELMACFFVTC